MITFKRLVAYGCSHTAGSETQDEDYVPNADLLKKLQDVFSLTGNFRF
jgi:hypothetical protein